MAAIERCRTAALGGHVARCEKACGYTLIAYNSLPQSALPEVPGCGGARMAGRTRGRALAGAVLSSSSSRCRRAIADIAYQNKAVVYDLLFKASAETMLTIAADPKHLGARIGIISVLHTWGSALTHHPHVHMIVPGGGLSRSTASDG